MLLNPDNLSETKEVKSGDLVEMIFPDEVSRKFPIFCCIYGLANMVTAFLVSWTLNTGYDAFSDVSLALGDQNSLVNFNDQEKQQIVKNLNSKSEA